jgi:hypothetical protein
MTVSNSAGDFLKATGAAGGGLMLAVSGNRQRQNQAAETNKFAYPERFFAPRPTVRQRSS